MRAATLRHRLFAVASFALVVVAAIDARRAHDEPSVEDRLGRVATVQPTPRIVRGLAGLAESSGCVPSERPTPLPALPAAVTVRVVDVGGPVHAGPVVVPGQRVLVVTTTGRLVLLRADGTVEVERSLSSGTVATPLVLADGSVMVGTEDGVWERVDPRGRTLSRGRLAGPIEGFSRAPDGGVVVVAGERVVFFDADSNLRVAHHLGARSVTRAAVSRDGTVYVGTQDERLVAIAADGRERWSLRLRADLDAAPTLAPDGVVYAATDDGTVVAVAPDGAVRFAVNVGAPVRSSLAFMRRGALVFGTQGPRPRLFALDGASGRLRWVRAMRFTDGPEDGLAGRIVLDTEDTVLVGGDDDALHRIDALGHPMPRLPAHGDVRGEPTALADGTVVFGSLDGSVRFVRAQVAIER